MNRQEALTRMTRIATRPGRAITSDETFELFAGLVPDSPWSTRLLKLRDIFNDLATAAVMINSLEPLTRWNEAAATDPSMPDDPELKTVRSAFVLLQNAMKECTPTIETHVAPMGPIPTPSPKAPQASADDLDDLLALLNPPEGFAPKPFDIQDAARQAGAMRYDSHIDRLGDVHGWSFRDEQLERFVKAVREHE
jgi:hypothetical protein